MSSFATLVNKSKPFRHLQASSKRTSPGGVAKNVKMVMHLLHLVALAAMVLICYYGVREG